jgi:lysophospholipase L1-like esterase
LRKTSAVLVIAVLGMLAALGSVAPVSAASAPTHGLRYVALGDSYSAGQGLGNPAPGSPAFCNRSADNFPHLIARHLDLTLTDVTCGGATTQNVVATPLTYGAASTPVQLDALSRSTRVVTITIGGNDLGFADVLRSCISLGADGPLLLSRADSCEAEYVQDGTDTLLQQLNDTVLSGTNGVGGLTATFAQIRRAAPRAKVFVVGYPTIMPDAAHIPAGGCFSVKLSGTSIDDAFADNIFPFTAADTIYLNGIQKALDASERTAAAKAGFTYVSLLTATADHSACAAADERYVNAVSLSRDGSGSLQLSAGSLHPDAAGAQFLAETVETSIVKAFAVHPRAEGERRAPVWPFSVWPFSVWGFWLIIPAAVVIAVVVIVAVRRRRRPAVR